MPPVPVIYRLVRKRLGNESDFFQQRGEIAAGHGFSLFLTTCEPSVRLYFTRRCAFDTGIFFKVVIQIDFYIKIQRSSTLDFCH